MDQFVINHKYGLFYRKPDVIRVTTQNLLEVSVEPIDEIFAAEEIYLHPLYEVNSHYNDIALLRLDREVE